ncbi:hypothetical protein FOQG_17664 [Fusarium oxysporum f. sp. raphani 54005]|jgi:hypothetical protein|uniref:Uncharacterized protein n=2 Tax=Fusarium oxysporum TaxID=5507 RepID=X0BGP5_FUSOX|nr:hypothetical protein FOVG_17134 [Fusarium oxysporum f. sp. pisi HDV247]EXK77644.1 hypothetical protein FOQG_17664 [Fusarium oxysporum f. sp. raphani 54005]
MLLLDKRAQAGRCPGGRVKYWRSMMAMTLAASPTASAVANDDILTVREAVSKVV